MKKSQASMEYLMVVGLVFVIIIPMVYVFYDYSTSVSQQVTEAKVQKIGNDIVSAGEEVFYLGPPSKTTVKFDLPAGIHEINANNPKELVFKVGDVFSYREVVIPSDVSLLSYLVPVDFMPGKKSFRVEAQSERVIIYTGNLSYAIPRWCAYYVASQIINKAALVYGDTKSRAVRLSIPSECDINDISISADNKKILIKLNDGGVPKEFTIDSPAPVAEEEEGVTLKTEDHTYDFLYMTSFVQIAEPACIDIDNDGYGTVLDSAICPGYDCNDNNANLNPGKPEVCGDGVDNNCDGKTDADDPDCVAACTDVDGDGYQDIACGGNDCDDADAAIHPGAAEICGNSKDDNCDGQTDEGCAGPTTLTCTYGSTTCSLPFYEVLRASGSIDAHASLPNQGSFTNHICCKIEGATLHTDCAFPQARFLQLSDTVDAHVQEYGGVGFLNDACLSSSQGTISCGYSGACTAYDTCLASISDTTDAHIGNCAAYTTKVCCKAT